VTLAREITDLAQASRHWDNAIRAVLNHDDAAYEREMSAFKRISATWKTKGREVANNGLPSNNGN